MKGKLKEKLLNPLLVKEINKAKFNYQWRINLIKILLS